MKKNTQAVYTQEQVDAIITAVMAKLAKPQTPVKAKKSAEQVEAERLAKNAAWAAQKAEFKSAANITDATVAKFEAIKAERFAQDWAKWVASNERNATKGDARKAANHAKAVELENSYRLLAGMTEKALKKA